MKPKVLCVLLGILIVTVLLIGIFLSFRNKEISVAAFSITDYKDIINQFSSNLHTNPVSTPKQAIEAAERIWQTTYGNSVNQNRPYIVSYDETSCVWLIHGSLPHNSIGGVPYLLIHEKGQIIAIWHSK